MSRVNIPIAALMCLALAAAKAEAQQAMEAKPHIYAPAEVVFGKGSPALPPGNQVAVIEGNPAEAGPFTMRLKLPDGYRVPPHFHPVLEHVTVIQGTFLLGQGEKAEWGTVKELPAGSFMTMPAKTPHYAGAKGETVIQLHGIGPWGITYVNAADDPRSKPTP